MAFRELDEFLDDSLRLPIGGKTYVVPPVDAETGLRFERLLAAGFVAASGGQVTEKIDFGDDDERNLYQRALTTAYDEMLADGVSWPRIKLAGVTAFFAAAGNVQLAEEYWASGGRSGEAAAPNRAQRRASTSTGAARTTRPRGSTSTTRSRKTS